MDNFGLIHIIVEVFLIIFIFLTANDSFLYETPFLNYPDVHAFFSSPCLNEGGTPIARKIHSLTAPGTIQPGQPSLCAPTAVSLV
jgi:hypothetical protein